MLALIKEREFVRVGELSERFGVSEVTVRTDLDSLATRGQVHRVRGGAIPRLIPRQEQPFEDSVASFTAEKIAIGQAAAALIRDGETVLIDVGTTAAAAARSIAARDELSDVVVFTNGLKTALELEPASPRIAIVVLGGTLRPLQHFARRSSRDPHPRTHQRQDRAARLQRRRPDRRRDEHQPP